MGGATANHDIQCNRWRFQSTLPVGGATVFKAWQAAPRPISIHAPRGGSDYCFAPALPQTAYFNPRSPWGERRYVTYMELNRQPKFQSTLPVGGATPRKPERPQTLFHFNPRSPWGERLFQFRICTQGRKFQSTLPVGGATANDNDEKRMLFISIHAPRGGSDENREDEPFIATISIHAPRGGSDRSARTSHSWVLISIHAPRGGSDKTLYLPQATPWVFQSTLPVGGATARYRPALPVPMISIHAPRGGSDCRNAESGQRRR